MAINEGMFQTLTDLFLTSAVRRVQKATKDTTVNFSAPGYPSIKKHAPDQGACLQAP